MANRPTDGWREGIAEEARDIASGKLAAIDAYMSELFPESLLSRTDEALATFESEVTALSSPSDEQVFGVVERVVLSLNTINDDHNGAGYETSEREMLCLYIDEVLAETGIDVEALTARHGLPRYAITDRWRRW
jgi:hypothetical protein